MIDPWLLIAFFLMRSKRDGGGGGGGRPPPRPAPPAPIEQRWARAIAATVDVSHQVAEGLGRAAVLAGAGPPTPEGVRNLFTQWETTRDEALRHKSPGVTWDDRDLLWYATVALLRPELLAGTGQKLAPTTVSILRAYDVAPDVFNILDQATWVATGQRLPPARRPAGSAPPPASSPPTPPAAAAADRIRVVPGDLPGAADAASR